MDMFKKYNTLRYRNSLETVMGELLKYHPLAIIEFIELHYNEKAILAYFNNDKCFKRLLDTVKRQLHEYKEKIGETKTTHLKFTMENAESIIKKGYATFSKFKLRGGAPGDQEPDVCPICFDNLDDDRIVIHPIHCKHLAHSTCIRMWARRSKRCPICTAHMVLPRATPEEVAELELAEPLAEFELAQQARFAMPHPNQMIIEQMQAQHAQQAQPHQHNVPVRQQRMLAFITGLLGLAAYNIDYVMEMATEAAMEIDPTMAVVPATIGSFAMLILFLFSIVS